MKETKWFRAARTILGRKAARNIYKGFYTEKTFTVSRKQLEQTSRNFCCKASTLAFFLKKDGKKELETTGILTLNKRHLRDFYNKYKIDVEDILCKTTFL